MTEIDDLDLMYDPTKGLMFFGAPNASNKIKKNKHVWLLKEIAKVAFTQVPPKLEAALEMHSDELLDLTEDFWKGPVYSFKPYSYIHLLGNAYDGEAWRIGMDTRLLRWA